jgi:uncharacterized protein YjbI with pentapeptide repeats
MALRVIGRRDADQRRVEARWGTEAAPNAEWVFDIPFPALPDREAGPSLYKAEMNPYWTRLDDWKDRIDSYAGYRLDLSRTNLQKTEMTDAVLSGAFLVSVRMEGATLQKAQLQRATLWHARMEHVYLWQARIEGALLQEAAMEGAYLVQARIEGANLLMARMDGANLLQARMAEAELWRTQMDGAFLVGARMEGANLAKARMEGANLSSVTWDAKTNLHGAVFSGASLRDTDLSQVRITQEQLDSAYGDGSMQDKLPKYLAWPAHWPTWELPTGFEDDFETQHALWRANPSTYVPPPPPTTP